MEEADEAFEKNLPTRLFATINGKQCGLEWSGDMSSGGAAGTRKAKFDCAGNADPVFKEGNKIYTTDDQGNKCGLEYTDSMDMNNAPAKVSRGRCCNVW